MKAWTAKEYQTRKRIEDIRRELEKQKIKLDMAFIRKVTKDASDHTAKLQELRKLQPALQQAWKRRLDLLQQRRQNKSRMFTIRQAFATVMNEESGLHRGGLPGYNSVSRGFTFNGMRGVY